jgi:hypothetical protein
MLRQKIVIKYFDDIGYSLNRHPGSGGDVFQVQGVFNLHFTHFHKIELSGRVGLENEQL